MPAAVAAPVDESPVVATVGEKTLTLNALDALIAAELKQAQDELNQKIYELRAQGVERFITESALEARRAQTPHADINALITAEAFSSLAEPTEEEIRAFFEQNRARIGEASFEEIKDRIAEFLGNQRRREAVDAYLARIRQSVGAVDLLEPPRVSVEAIGFSKGPDDAPITIVEFADFECGYCSRAGDTMKQVMDKYPGKVRVVYRDFPLSFHQNAQPASVAARCAGAQGKYWEMHDTLFANQSSLNPESYIKWATELGLDVEAFKACSDDPKQAAAVQADFEAGVKLGVNGTPAFFVNGVNLSGARPVEDFVKVIDRELAKAAR